MSVTPIVCNENLILANDEAGRRPPDDGELRNTPPDGEPGDGPTDGESNKPLPVAGEDAEVGLGQKGTGEDAVVCRETEI